MWILAIQLTVIGPTVAVEGDPRLPSGAGTPGDCERLSWEFAHQRGSLAPLGSGRPAGPGAAGSLDADGDGLVSPDEAAARREAAFVSLDGDEDGRLTVAELAPFAPLRGWRERFRAMDTNADGAVDRAEFMAGGQRHYDASDLDGDGAVTVWEYRSRPRP